MRQIKGRMVHLFILPVSLCVTVFLILTASAHAATELDRPVLSQLQKGGIQVWSQLDYFTPSLDVINYQQKVSTSSSLRSYSDTQVGLRYAFTDNLNMRYSVGLIQQRATRTTAPKIINSNAFKHDLRLQYQFYHKKHLHLGFELGYRTHIAKPLSFYTYQFGNNIISWGGRPLVILNTKDHAWITAFRGAWEFNDSLVIHAGVEARKVTVRALMTSANPDVRLFLSPLAPQKTPWNETQLLFQMALDWRILESLSLSLDYTRYQISRSHYQPRTGKPDYNTQDQIDAYMSWSMNKNWAIFGHGRLNSHFLLGDVPMAYNQRVNHKFKHPFALLSMGLNWSY